MRLDDHPILKKLFRILLSLPAELVACRKIKQIQTTFHIFVYPNGSILVLRKDWEHYKKVHLGE